MEPESDSASFEVLVPSVCEKTSDSDVPDMDPGTKEESRHDNIEERLDTIQNLQTQQTDKLLNLVGDTIQNLQTQQTDKLVNLVDKKLSSLFGTLETEKTAMKKQIKEAVDSVVTSVAENAPKDHPENFDQDEFFSRMQHEIESGILHRLRKYAIILGLSMLLLFLAMSGIFFFVNIRYAGIHNYSNQLANEMSALAKSIKRANSMVEEVQMAMTSKGMTNENEATGVIIGFQEEMTEMKDSVKKLSVDVKELEGIMKTAITDGIKPSDDLIKFQRDIAEMKASIGKLPIDMVKDLMQKVETCDTKAAKSVELKVDTLLNEIRNVKSELKLSDDMLSDKIYHTSDKHLTVVAGAFILVIILVVFCYSSRNRGNGNANAVAN